MNKTKHFLRPLLMAIVMLVGMLVPQGAWAQITLITESDDEIWCESMDVALTIFRQDSWMLGDGPVTMRFDSDIAISEELDCQNFGRDITFDLNGHVLTNEPWAEGWMSCIFAFYSGCRNRITIQNGTIESNELDAIYFQGVNWDHYQKLILKNVNVVTHQEGRHCLFDAGPFDWGNWGYDGDPESSPKLQIIDSQFHSNGCSAISFTLLSNDEYVKSILPEGYSFYNANTDVELAEYADRPFVDENGNPATDIRTGVSQAKIKISNPDGYEDEGYCGNFKQAMDIYGFYGMTLTLLDDVKEGLCTTNSNCMSVTIDLNGHTLDITRLYANGDYLNIIDSSEGKTGKLIVERFDVYGQTENNAVIEGNVKTWVNNLFTNNGLVEYVDGDFINNGDFITSWTWADDHSSATLRINHEDVDAVVTNEDTTPATCIASGVRTYTAAATYRDRNYADTKDEEIAIDPNAHSYTNNTLTASPVEDGLYAYACDNGCGQGDEHRFIKDFNGAGIHLELTKDGEGNYSTSENVTLADGASFSSPVDFTANSVTYTRTGIKNQWGTIVVPFNVNGIGADYDLYTLFAMDEYNLTLIKFDGTLPAGTPVIFRLHDDLAGDYSLTLTASNTTVSGQFNEGSEANGLQLVGTYETTELDINDYFISNNQFWRVYDAWAAAWGVKVAPFRAYLKSKWAGAKASSLSIRIADEDDDVTAVETLNAITDGTAEYYDMNGRRINSLQKGVNIVKYGNGKTKKITVK